MTYLKTIYDYYVTICGLLVSLIGLIVFLAFVLEPTGLTYACWKGGGGLQIGMGEKPYTGICNE